MKNSGKVKVCSLCGSPSDRDGFLPLIRQAADQHPDIILLPETWEGIPPVGKDAPIFTELSQIACQYHVYLLHCCLFTENQRVTNSAFLFDRQGHIIGRYDKRYPYWEEMKPYGECVPGNRPCVVDCDFGRVGIAICFDANFNNVWEDMAKLGADMVLWPSAYAAGNQLCAHALNYHFQIVTSTQCGSFMAIDLDGSRIREERSSTLKAHFVTINLNRCIFHENFNMAQRNALLAEEHPRVALEKEWPDEQWFILKACDEAISVADVCREAHMEPLREYKLRSMQEIDQMRIP